MGWYWLALGWVQMACATWCVCAVHVCAHTRVHAVLGASGTTVASTTVLVLGYSAVAMLVAHACGTATGTGDGLGAGTVQDRAQYWVEYSTA